MMKVGVLTVGCMAAAAAQAQSGAAGFFNPMSASQNGIHLNDVNVYGGYFSGGSPYRAARVGGDYGYACDWRKYGRRRGGEFRVEPYGDFFKFLDQLLALLHCVSGSDRTECDEPLIFSELESKDRSEVVFQRLGHGPDS